MLSRRKFSRPQVSAKTSNKQRRHAIYCLFWNLASGVPDAHLSWKDARMIYWWTPSVNSENYVHVRSNQQESIDMEVVEARGSLRANSTPPSGCTDTYPPTHDWHEWRTLGEIRNFAICGSEASRLCFSSTYDLATYATTLQALCIAPCDNCWHSNIGVKPAA